MTAKANTYADEHGRYLVIGAEVSGLKSADGSWLPLPQGFGRGRLPGWRAIGDARLEQTLIAEAGAAIAARAQRR